MRKIIILSSVLLIVIAVLAIRYFSELSGNDNNNAKVLKYIPSDAALVICFNNDESFYDIFNDYEPFNAILGENRAAELTQLRTLLLKQAPVNERIGQQKIFISFHPAKADSVNLLFSLELREKIAQEDVFELFKNLNGMSLKKDDAAGIYKVTFNAGSRPFFLYISEGIVNGSFSEDLLKQTVNSGSKKISKEFINEINENSSKNQNSPVSLFINHETLPSFFSSFIRGRHDGNSSLLKDMRGISSLSMNFKSNALMFNGTNNPDTSSHAYLNIFLTQRPVRNQLKNLLPENTANAILFGCSDYKKFHSALKVYLAEKGDLKQLQNQVRAIRSRSGINIENDVKPLISNEFAVVETKNRERLGIVKVSDGSRVSFTLRLISEQINENTARFNNSNILYYYFGDPFKSFVRPYFTVVDNYLVISNTNGAIQNYLNDYSGNKFISKTKEYADHDQLVANKSNILYFLNNKNSEEIIRRTLRKGYAQNFTDENYGLKNFYGFSWQWSSDGTRFQLNLYADYNTNSKKELKSVWSFRLNSRLAMAPQIIRYGKKNAVLVQDNVNNVYAITDNGEKIWAYQIDNQIQGSVHQLNDGSLLFNTSRKLYRIDLKGNNLQGFPVDLPFIASAGLLSSNTDPRSTRIFIPAQTMILAYNSSGKTIEGWNKELPGKILYDLKLVSSNNASYIAAGTREGKFFFFNYNGSLMREAEVKEKTQFRNPLFADSQNPEIVTTDTSGATYYIDINGTISEKPTGTWSPEHSFVFSNVTGDENPELIYLDKSQLSVYNKDGSLIYTYNFDQLVKPHLQILNLDKDEYLPGVSSSQNNMLFLFDGDGNLFKGFPVKGFGDFYIGYLKNDGIRYLLTGTSDSYLKAYKL